MQVFDPLRLTLCALALALLCSGAATANEVKKASDLPAMRWDHAAKAAEWTAEALAQVAEHDAELTHLIPKDIEVYCPGYAKASAEDRRAFWVSVLSATAKYESGFNAKAVGLHGRYVGLMQITLATARHSGCDATTTATLKDGKANLSCAIDIVAPPCGCRRHGGRRRQQRHRARLGPMGQSAHPCHHRQMDPRAGLLPRLTPFILAQISKSSALGSGDYGYLDTYERHQPIMRATISARLRLIPGLAAIRASWALISA